MNVIPAEKFVKIADFWVNRSWPLSLVDAESAALELGWERIGRGLFDMPYPLTNKTVIFTAGGDQAEVDMINFRATDVVLEQSLERDAFMNDFFVDAVHHFKAVWPKPVLKKVKEEHAANWVLPNGCEVQLANRWKVLHFVLLSPGYAEVERYLRGRR